MMHFINMNLAILRNYLPRQFTSSLISIQSSENRGSPQIGVLAKKLGRSTYKLLSETGALFSLFVLYINFL